jgi:hypothetical protein
MAIWNIFLLQFVIRVHRYIGIYIYIICYTKKSLATLHLGAQMRLTAAWRTFNNGIKKCLKRPILDIPKVSQSWHATLKSEAFACAST